MQKAVIIYGSLCSGKGTQANLLEKVSGFYHFDTGRYIEQVVRDPEKLKDKAVRRERKLFDEGILCTPSWVLKIVRKKTQEIAAAGSSIVFSGSPRTLFEAFGDSKNEGLIEILEKAYGKKNICAIFIKVSPKTSLWRTARRSVCSVCGAPVLYKKDGIQRCPFCDGPVRKRSLDTPEVLKVRLNEYKTRTLPILEKLKKRRYKISVINGEPPPYKVFESILKKVRK